MISDVEKRNGEIESFMPEKIMGWVRWAEADLGRKNSWWPVIVDVIGSHNGTVKSKTITESLIKGFVNLDTWIGERMAGRLYAIELYRDTFGDKVPPSVKFVQERAIEDGFMRSMGYTDEQYEEIENMIVHDRDLSLPHFALDYARKKYAIQNRKTKEVYETQQFTYMRLAMAIFENEKQDTLAHVKNMYDVLSESLVTAPTPNFSSLGTNNPAAVSCVLYMGGDTANSIAAANHIAELCVVAGAGLGGHLNLRSPGDPVKGGAIIHEGRYKYYRTQSSLATQNKQGPRGGALTMHFDIFNPEAEMLINLRNPRTPEARRNRLMHYSVIHHPEFIRRSLLDLDVFSFNVFTAPDLWEAIFSKDPEEFPRLYEKYEKDPLFPKKYTKARDLHLMAEGERYATGTVYELNALELNRHTPFLEPIYQSNLCQEIAEPTKPYTSVQHLYRTDDHQEGEIATCNLGGINVAYLDITEENEERYAKAAYYALRMIDSTILNSVYPFPHMNFTARQRMNAGTGMHGLTTLLARNKIDPSTKEGLEFLHQVGERHAYHLIQASIRISKERGLAPWIHKTAWKDGWTPMKTYNRNVDTLGDWVYRYDWDEVSDQIRENGGIAHSCLIAHMPGESSTKPIGVPNSLWMLREISISKTDGGNKTNWIAPLSDEEGVEYTFAYDMTQLAQVKVVAVMQKWTDQTVSFEVFRRVGKAESIPSTEILELAEAKVFYGVKTGYYCNTNTHSDNRATTYLTALNRPYYDEETMRALVGDKVLEEVQEICAGCDA